MKAYGYGPNGPAITDVAKPQPQGTQVLVKVKALGLNRADIGMAKGHAHGAAGGVGTVLGMEWSGEVAELGPDFDLHAARRISYIGVTFRTRSIDEIREIFDEVKKDIWGAVESRRLRLPVDKVFGFDDIGKAFEHMEANRHFGKIVVTL